MDFLITLPKRHAHRTLILGIKFVNGEGTSKVLSPNTREYFEMIGARVARMAPPVVKPEVEENDDLDTRPDETE